MATQNSAESNRSRESDNYNLTLYEVCELLGKSTRTITRYVQKHILHPRAVKSCQGTLEYRFNRREVYMVRENEKNLRPYLFTENGQASPLPDYAQASFAACGYTPPVSPPQTAFLVPGAPFPLQQSHFPQTVGPQFYPQTPQNFDFGATQGNEHPRMRADEARPRRNQNQKRVAPPPFEQKEEPPSRANEEIVLLLKETTEMLRGQLKTKDDQIKNLDDKIGQLIERNRETNILLKGLQDKIMLLEQPKNKRENRERNPAAPREFVRREDPPQEPAAVPSEKPPVEISNMGISEKIGVAELPVPTPDSKNTEFQSETKRKGLFGKIFG